MSKYRLRYEKGEAAKYISHLDFVRTIGRTFRRAKLPVQYSQGFNPHMVMTVALPISVGVTSSGEYMEVALTCDVDPDELVAAINNAIPDGLTFLAAKKVGEGDIPLSRVASAVYRVDVACNTVPDLDAFLNMPEILVEKKTKKGVAIADIRPDILSICQTEPKEGVSLCYRMHLSAGNTRNLKPETVLCAMERHLLGFSVSTYRVHRENMYFDKGLEILQLGEQNEATI